MCRSILSKVMLFLTCPIVSSFVPFTRHASSSMSKTMLHALPTVSQLSKDPFMKQVTHASEIVPLLSTNENDSLSSILAAQLSHSDGIRGFFVCYLTGDGQTAADDDIIPPPLASAIKTISDREDLISLACMNVIMPTAMSTIHSDERLQVSSATTAKRGVRVLKYLKTIDSEKVVKACDSIVAATQKEQSENSDVLYWKEFFSKYGYEEQQIDDIRTAFSSVGSSF